MSLFIPRQNINPHWTLLLVETQNLSKHTSWNVGLVYREAYIKVVIGSWWMYKYGYFTYT